MKYLIGAVAILIYWAAVFLLKEAIRTYRQRKEERADFDRRFQAFCRCIEEEIRSGANQ
jgi:hypothetical protein